MMAEYHEPTQNSNDHFLDSNDDKNGWVLSLHRNWTKWKAGEEWYSYIVIKHLVLHWTKLHSISPLFIWKTTINIQGYPKNTFIQPEANRITNYPRQSHYAVLLWSAEQNEVNDKRRKKN